ncbi:MAG: hypothetical protein Q9222_000783 [Ikaeria aurantiellina]
MGRHPEAAKHIEVLLAYSDHKYGQDFAAATELFRTGLVSQKHLEKLFLPNTPILVKRAGPEDADRVYIMYTWPEFAANGGMVLNGWCWQHNGRVFVRRTDTWILNPISTATVAIQSLQIYPLSFAPEHLKKNLGARGQKYWSYRELSHVSYTGWNVSHDEFYPESRFMIDYKVYWAQDGIVSYCLTKRTYSLRNVPFSVFLRILEYYDGILILTSNRVGTFDEAFKSPIQVALHYPNLTQASRKKIWTNFIHMLEEDDENVSFDEIRFHLDDLATYKLNGRQIRNTLTTARQLAMFKSHERLDWKHVQQALKVSTDFSDYLQNMHGHTDDENARDRQIR